MKKGRIDYYFLMTVFGLLAMGLIMVMSASSESARYASFTNGDAYYFIKRQLLWAVISIVIMFVVSVIDYHFIGRFSHLLLGGVVFLLILVLFVGTEVNGGKRWILGFQPSELAKVAVILFFAYHISKNPKFVRSFKGFLFYLVVIGIIGGLLMLEPHLSATVIIAAVGISIMFVAGSNIKHLLALGIPSVTLLVCAIAFSDYRRQRFLAFLDPFKDAKGDGWQIIQSLYAIGSGGMFGLGLGQSRQKNLYIPEPHNDFIFSILCEELGFIGAFFVILMFAVLIWRGIKIAMNAKDTFGSLTAMGITLLVAYQVIINIAVVTSSMPVTGVALPFFSYGGTSLLMIMSSMGILLNISRQGSQGNDYKHIKPEKKNRK